MKYYAIKGKETNKIFDKWEDAKKYIALGNIISYKSFTSIEEANAYLNDEEFDDNVIGIKAYIDGSYDIKTENYSFGGVLIYNDMIYKFNKKYEKDEFSSYRNVAGEIKGAGYIINHAINLGIKELHLYYDYLGIEKWWDFSWKAKSKIGILYQDFALKNKNKINVIFHKIKSHTNNKYNDLADKLAKEALE